MGEGTVGVSLSNHPLVGPSTHLFIPEHHGCPLAAIYHTLNTICPHFSPTLVAKYLEADRAQ